MRLSFNLAPDVSDLQNKLTALKNQGVAKFDKVFTGIDSLTQNDDCITLNCSPALFPFDKKSLLAYFNDESLFGKQLLSDIIHTYTTDDNGFIENVIFQMRSKKTVQGHNEIQSAAAGFIDYNEHPRDAALREFTEEVKLDAVLANKNPIGLVNHNVAGINNPCLVYVAKLVDSDALTKYKVVDDLAGFDRLQEIDDFEVAKIALVPYNKAKSFWSEVVKQERDFGRWYNSLNESFSQLFDYLKLII